VAGRSGFRWILDPIDGTRSFVQGVPLFGTLIGIEVERQSVIGVIRLPALDETVYAARGAGAWCERGGAAPPPARSPTGRERRPSTPRRRWRATASCSNRCSS
jgi:fructose-1,6-bisphosphatase/inositol monophosphatase family enzyme